jgi:hypothetical protein
MTTLTREQIKRLRNDFECWQQDYDPTADREQYKMFGDGMAAMDMLLAAMQQEPVAYMTYKGYLLHAGDPKLAEYSEPTPLYDAPPAPVSMKDHHIRELVNELRDIAVEYHGTQQLRERIARTIRAAMLQAGNSPVVPDGWISCSERIPESDDFVYIWPRPDFGVELHAAQHGKFDKRNACWYAQVYEQNYGIEYHPITVTHWMPLPAAPQQEVK